MMENETPPEVPAEAPAPESAGAQAVLPPETVMDSLRQVIDPELHYNIVDIGLVYDVAVALPKVTVTMTLTSPGCPYGPLIIHEVKETVKSLGAEDVAIDIVWDPPWGPDRMSEEIKLELGFDL